MLGKLEQELESFCSDALDRFVAHEELEAAYGASHKTATVWEAWKRRVSSSVLVGAREEVLRSEFARQTAYVYLVRLLLVRICEDKRLFRRKLSDGGFVLWHERSGQYLDYASGRSYEYLTRMAYECAQNVYVHFYGASQLFDWYRMDDKMLLRALVVLNGFNLERIDTDIIGAVYGRYLTEGKHEQGRYYTPRPLVRTMLDLAGWEGAAVVDRRLCDLACGSGSFLVDACRRILDRYRGPDGRIPHSSLAGTLRDVQRSLYGIDLNPFACYLAETNLLIQVLDLVRDAQEAGITLAVERFNIYCEDSLMVNESLSIAPGAATLLGSEHAVGELIKARAGPFRDGFEVLIGNPPYVRADEDAPSYQAYRGLLEEQSWFTTRHLKWDLYVPFVEQYHRLLADKPDARSCLVTISSVGDAPYAEKLRELLARRAKVHDVVFAQDLGLFTDASWQDNVIFCFSRGEPGPEHKVRRNAAKEPIDGVLPLEPLDEVVQVSVEPGRLFNPRPTVELDLDETVRWDEICYVSKGMVLHSHEGYEEGEIVQVPASYEPGTFGEELVESLGADGKRIRHRVFGREALAADEPDSLHTRPYLESREVLRGGVGRIRWLEYGAHTRCPARISRPTFPELYDRPKVMFGKFTGVALDDGSGPGFYVVSDAVRVSVRWTLLEGIDNRSLSDARTELEGKKAYDPALSEGYAEWYLCALALSEPIQKWLASHKRSMKDDVYPDDIKAIPVKRLSPSKQQPFVALAKERHRLLGELAQLEQAGYRVREPVEVPIRQLAERFQREHPRVKHLTLLKATAKGLFRIEGAFLDRDLRKARAVDNSVMVGRTVAVQLGDRIEERTRVAALLARYLAAMPGTFADRQEQDVLPGGEAGLVALAAFVDAEEEAVRGRLVRIKAINAALDALAWELYRPRATTARSS